MNYFINQDFGRDIYSSRTDFLVKISDVDPNLSVSELKDRIAAIADRYTTIINSSETVLYYLCFDLSIGVAKRKTGFALDPLWAKGVYEAAKVDYKVYTRLVEVVCENLRLNVAVPAKLKLFASEVMACTFPVPKKQGPAVTRDKLRNLAIFECLVFLCEKMDIQHGSEAKDLPLTASSLVENGFSHVEYFNGSIGKPTSSVIKRVWKKKHREQMRYELSMLRWLENKQKSNRWYKKFGILFWVTKNY